MRERIRQAEAPSSVDRLLAEAERRNEIKTGLWRFAVIAALAVSAFFETDANYQQTHLHLLLAYGGISLVAVLLGLAGFFRPWLDWVYVLVDALLVVHLMSEHMMGGHASASAALVTPSLVIAFVLLSHASMRLRIGPIIAYTALIVIGIVAIWIFQNTIMSHAFSIEQLKTDAVWLLSFVAAAAMQIFIVRGMRRLLREAVTASRERINLTRFFPPEIAERIADKGGISGMRRLKAAILFVDIRGFTNLAEKLDPEETASLLADYRRHVTNVVFDTGGTVDKFVGDGVMAVFGFPSCSDNDAENAFRCALNILNRLHLWNEARFHKRKVKLEVGIGVHYGEVMGGVIPGGSHSEYTVIGDVVNVADRLQRLSKILKSNVVISEELKNKLRDKDMAFWKNHAGINIEGRINTINVYSYSFMSDTRNAVF